jgi:hypothetical protein
MEMSGLNADFTVIASMPHFYFQFRQGETLIEDDEGQVLPDLAAAQNEALKSLCEIVSERVLAADEFPDAVVITDADGKEIASVPVASVFYRPLKVR